MSDEFYVWGEFNLDHPPFFGASGACGVNMKDCAREYLIGLREGVRHSSLMTSGMTYGEFSLYVIYKRDEILPLLLSMYTDPVVSRRLRTRMY
jgi:hypothetical protein